MTRVGAFLVTFALLPAAASPQAITFSEALAGRRPSADELDARLLLAEARRAAAGAGSRAAEAPSVSALAGPRRNEDGSSAADVSIGFELPLLSGRGARDELARQVDLLTQPLARGTAAVAAADLASAFVEVWLAQAGAEVRAEDLAAAEAWLAATQRRVEAGADPPYETPLVAGERDRALVELVAARRDVELAWGDLAALADVGPTPRAVTLDGLPGRPESDATSGASAATSIDARENLALALQRASGSTARSRWALQSEVASEGDERLAHVGLAYRLPLRGERSAIEQEQSAAEERAKRDAERARVALRARLAAAQTALDASPVALVPQDLERAQTALSARLAEGKERASEILPLRRQLLEARLAGLAARAARARAAAEIHFLVGGLPDAP